MRCLKGGRLSILALIGCLTVTIGVSYSTFLVNRPMLVLALSIVLLLPVLWSLYAYKWHYLYVLRLAALIGPALITAVLLLATEGEIKFSHYGAQYQNPHTAVTVLLMGVAAALVTAMMWRFARGRKVRGNTKIPELAWLRVCVYVVVGVVSGCFAAASLPGFVWDEPYSRGMIPWMNIGVFQVLAPFSVIAVYVVLAKWYRRNFVYWLGFIVFATFILGICLVARGARLDAVGAVIGIVLVWYAVKQKRHTAFALVALLVTLYSAVISLGIYRAYAHCGTSLADAAIIFVQSMGSEARSGCAQYHTKRDIENATGKHVTEYNLSTIGDVAGTLYQFIGRVDEEKQEYLLGKTYAQYLQRIAPQMINPSRHRDMDFLSDAERAATTGGSFYELAEAYINFGIVGVLLISAFWTWLLGVIAKTAEGAVGYYELVAYGIAGTLLIRGTWYQNFSFFKAALTWVMVEAAVLALVLVVNRLRFRTNIEIN